MLNEMLAPALNRPVAELRERLPIGTAQDCAEKLAAYHNVGVQRVYLWPLPKWVEKEIVALLSSNGIKPWYSKASISTASQWEREILRGMESCDWFLLVVSPRAAKSEWIKDELNWAVYNRPTRIVPVIMEKCNLWDFHIRLPRIQNIDFTQYVGSTKKALVGMFKEAA
jgi:hypothetical protein